MQVTFDDKLIEYMSKKGYCAIAVDIVDSKTCCSGYSEIVCTFVNQKHIKDLEGKIRKRLSSDNANLELLIMARLDIDEEIYVSLKRFLGIADVSIKGIRAFSL